jgi:hypothetical protein
VVKIAILDSVLPAQISERPQDLDGIEVVWKGPSVEELRRVFGRAKLDVLVLDLDTVGGDDPVAHVRDLQLQSGAELVITLYRFARRDVVDRLARDGRKAIKAPISLAALRGQMLGVLVRSIFSEEKGVAMTAITPRTFTHAQLGRLAEIQSAVQCECPNHLSNILLSLVSFEEYSAKCENQSPEDAAVHHALYESTAQARTIMERALEMLVRHEKIVL